MNPILSRVAVLSAALLALAMLSGCARAEPLVSLSVLDLDRGEHLPRYPHQGRDYIEGRPGHRYAVVLQNLTGGRVLAVVSVDGVNAISGETAGAQQSGYVLEPWQRLEVRGWRKNLSEIAEFHFTSLGDSYAARTGRPGNVGVIGVAAFRERVRIPEPPVHYSPYSGAPAPVAPPPYGYDRAEAQAGSPANAQERASADAAAPALESSRAPGYEERAIARQQLGTGHGERRWSSATVTQFVRESHRPNQVTSIWYDAAEALVARGILPRWRHPHDPAPDAFPVGFAPDPY